MEKTTKIEEIEVEFSELIPNPAGIPCRNENSQELREEHDHWRKETNENRCKKFSHLNYWEKMSVCTSL